MGQERSTRPVCSRNADAMDLWIVFCLMTAVAALIVVVPMQRARRAAATGSVLEISVYADQLAEVERDFQRELIGETEVAAARTEISRRILRADLAASTKVPGGSGRLRLVVGIIICIVIPIVAIGLYVKLGAPSLPDQPLAERKAAPVDTLSPEDLVARLDSQLAANPTDVRGWDLAGPIYMRIGRFPDAVNAFRTAIRLGGSDLRRQAGLGEALTAIAQGVVTAEARTAFEAAQKLDPSVPLPNMYLALALSQDGRFQESVDAWKRVIATARGDESWVAPARKELAGVEAQLAKQTGASPPANAKPSTDPGAQPAQPAGTAQSTPEPNAAQPMIEGMVARLAQRLDTQGGTPEEWGRLIKSYLVLGRTDDAKATYTKAKTAFSANPTASAALSTIVTELGLTE